MISYDEFRELKVERSGDILTVTIEKPGNGHEHTELSRLFGQIRHDDVAVVVLTGVGDYFMPLADMSWYATVDQSDWQRLMREGRWLIRDMVELPQPIVVSLNGDAVGLGASIMSFADVIIAASGVTIRDAHISMGLVAGDGGVLSFPLSMGVHRAKAFYLLGQSLTAEELHASGVIAEVVPRDSLDARVREVALQLASQPHEALQWTKAALNRAAQLALVTGDSALTYEGWSWHLPPAQANHDRLRRDQGLEPTVP
jgi:enoyl-CoA hydratase